MAHGTHNPICMRPIYSIPNPQFSISNSQFTIPNSHPHSYLFPAPLLSRLAFVFPAPFNPKTLVSQPPHPTARPPLSSPQTPEKRLNLAHTLSRRCSAGGGGRDARAGRPVGGSIGAAKVTGNAAPKRRHGLAATVAVAAVVLWPMHASRIPVEQRYQEQQEEHPRNREAQY